MPDAPEPTPTASPADEAASATSAAPKPDDVPASPKPEDTADYWKARARQHEDRAKANAAAASKLAELERAQMTESERAAAQMTELRAELDRYRTESTRLQVASAHGVPADYVDMLGSGTEDELKARAERLAPALKAAAEVAALRAEVEALRTGQRPPVPSDLPVASLRPGATAAPVSDEDAVYAALFGSAK